MKSFFGGKKYILGGMPKRSLYTSRCFHLFMNLFDSEAKFDSFMNNVYQWRNWLVEKWYTMTHKWIDAMKQLCWSNSCISWSNALIIWHMHLMHVINMCTKRFNIAVFVANLVSLSSWQIWYRCFRRSNTAAGCLCGKHDRKYAYALGYLKKKAVIVDCQSL